MIINYESCFKVIKQNIDGYTNNPHYRDNKVWENIVSGMKQALHALEEVKRNSSYDKALAGLDSEQLANLKKCIEKRLDDIEKEEKTTVLRLCIDGENSYYLNQKSLQRGLCDILKKENCNFASIKSDRIYVPKNDLSSYEIID